MVSIKCLYSICDPDSYDECCIYLLSDELGKMGWQLCCDSKAQGEEFSVTCDYLVIATGHHAKPKLPEFPGQDNFAGKQTLD